jgi:hypothetical protein
MGNKTMNALGVVKALAAKNWLPAKSDPRTHISYLLVYNCPNIFERAEQRGFYRVLATAPQQVSGNKEEPKTTFREMWASILHLQGAFTTRNLAAYLQRHPRQIGGSLVALEKRNLLTRTNVEGEEVIWEVTAKGRGTAKL